MQYSNHYGLRDTARAWCMQMKSLKHCAPKFDAVLESVYILSARSLVVMAVVVALLGVSDDLICRTGRV